MEPILVFKAPWGQTLTTVTVCTCVLLVGMVILFVRLGIQQHWGGFLVALLPLFLLVITAFFMVRSYEIVGDRLVIERLGWQTEIALNNLESATYEPNAMDNSLRLLGNGGLFSFTGLFWNKKLGRYQAYATALRSSVVLKFSDKIVIVTPEKPEQFIAQLMQR